MVLFCSLVHLNNVRVDLKTFTKWGNVTTLNVIAETKGGDPNNILYATAHLDSVRSAPGVNDDGSGAMATLELAHAFHRSGLHKQTAMVYS
jgi:Zn-dependent M28 family amino/carboxypeptidase